MWRTLRFDNCFNISQRFYSKSTSKISSIQTLKSVLRDYQDIEVGPYRVQNSGTFGLTFSEAHTHVFPYCVDVNNRIVDPYFVDAKDTMKLHSYAFDFKSLFADGIKQIDKFIYNKQDSIKLADAINTLNMFLETKDFHEQCLFDLAVNKSADLTELDITVLLANHLFLPLTSSFPVNRSPVYGVIDKESQHKISSCPCSSSCNATIHYGSTGFGSGYLWYGKSDIVLFPLAGGKMTIMVRDGGGDCVTSFEEIDQFGDYREIVDVKQNVDHLRTHQTMSEAASHAITFSFCQNKYQRDKMADENITTLIPTILTCRHYFDVYFYDSENDVFLRSLNHPIPIFEQQSVTYGDHATFLPKFNLNSVFKLWMLINHLLLKPNLTVSQLNRFRGTCGIQGHIEKLKLTSKIEENLNIGVDFEQSVKQPVLQTGYLVEKLHG